MRLHPALMAAPAALLITLAGCSAPEAENTPPPSTSATVAPEPAPEATTTPAPAPEAPSAPEATPEVIGPPPVEDAMQVPVGPYGEPAPSWAVPVHPDGAQYADLRDLTDPAVLDTYGLQADLYWFADEYGTMCPDSAPVPGLGCADFEYILEAVILSEITTADELLEESA